MVISRQVEIFIDGSLVHDMRIWNEIVLSTKLMNIGVLHVLIFISERSETNEVHQQRSKYNFIQNIYAVEISTCCGSSHWIQFLLFRTNKQKKRTENIYFFNV